MTRKIISLLKEYRQIDLEAKGAPAERITQMKESFDFIDNQLNHSFNDNEVLAEVMTSADFTYAIMEFVKRSLLPGYERKGFNFEPLVRNRTVPNFLPVTDYQNRAGVDDLEYVGEKGEARPGSVEDATKRQYRVYKWEKQYDFSMEALVNDDLGYLDDTARLMGESARRSLEKFVSRMMTNATTIARLVGLGALYSTTGRLTTARISEARMAFNQRVDDRGEPIVGGLRYLVYHSGLVDTVAQIQNSTLVPELATNASNVVKGTFVPIENPYIVGAAPNLPWYAFADPNNITAFVLARRQGVTGPMILRKKSDIESATSITGSGSAVAPIWGDFATGNIILKVHDEWGTYIDAVEGNLFDYRGAYYSSGTAA
jgi:hypothetical protein